MEMRQASFDQEIRSNKRQTETVTTETKEDIVPSDISRNALAGAEAAEKPPSDEDEIEFPELLLDEEWD